MKQFKRMLLLNWHYMHRECVSFSDINFLTGKNASGKSTLIDAMQLLLLGDTTGHFFNKAANDKSKRTLLGYAKGELSDQDTSFNYLRNGQFTTHLAMEVFDDEKKRYFVIGFLMDVFEDNSDKRQFYWFEGKLPDHEFVRDNKAMSSGQVKQYLKSKQKRYKFYSSNTEYRNDFKAKMGSINDKYFSLFRKAVPFSPIADIKAFITEFICDTENKVDITHMQENIRHYERMKQEAEEIEQMVSALEGIEAAFELYTQEKEREHLYKYLTLRGEMEALKKNADNFRRTVQKLEKDIQTHQHQLEKLKEKQNLTEIDLQVKRGQLVDFEPYRIEQECKRQIEEAKKWIAFICKENERTKRRILSIMQPWSGALKEATTDIKTDIDALYTLVRQGIALLETNQFTLDYDAVAAQMKTLREAVVTRHRELDRSYYGISREVASTEQNIRSLRDGIKPYSPQVVQLKQALEDELKRQYKQDVSVDIFCELIDVRDQKWKNAIEGYLHTQKFHLIVAPKYFQDALQIYDKKKKALNLYGVGLVDVERVMASQPSAAEGSLAKEVLSDNVYAQAYATFLLGGVMKCEKVQELRNHRTAITPTCMLYKNFVASQLNPKRYSVPFIGRHAIEQQIVIAEKLLTELRRDLKAVAEQLEPVKRLMQLRGLDEAELEECEKASRQSEELVQYESAVDKLHAQIDQLDMTAVYSLQQEVKALEQQLHEVGEQIMQQRVEVEGKSKRVKDLSSATIPNLDKLAEDKAVEIAEGFEETFIHTLGQPRYEKEVKRLREPRVLQENFQPSVKAAENKKNQYFRETTELRSQFATVFRRDLGIWSEHNDKYSELLDKLRKTELPLFREKIDEAIKKAQQEFQDDFISKLKYNIETVRGQITELNSSLRSIRFGKDRYRFMVRPNAYYRNFYDMIMDDMLMNGYNLFSSDFRHKHKDVIDELFKKIVDVGEGAISADERAELEKNIEKYTDYRTYLDFDLIVTNEEGEESHLSKMIDKKSGGETQTPFFISVLASFSRVYRMNQTKQNNTMRLIIFDEAFSKMDHERIEESLKLLRSMGFQTLISAPTEKIANIAPYADKTLCVLRSKHSAMVKEFDVLPDGLSVQEG